MKFKARIKGPQICVKAKTSSGEVIDPKELDRFSRVYFRGFLKPSAVKKNAIEYMGPVGISLYDKFRNPITKREFLFILEQAVVAIQNLRACKFPVNGLVMDLKNIYINESTKEVQFIYVPTMNGMPNMNLVEFFQSIAYSAKPGDMNDNQFISRFLYFFQSLRPFNIEKIEEFIESEDKSVINVIKRQSGKQSGFMTNKQQHYYEHYDAKKEVYQDELTGLLTDDDATGLLTEDDDATGLLTVKDDVIGGLVADPITSGDYYGVPQVDTLDNYSDDDYGEMETALLVENHLDDDPETWNNANVSVHYPTLFRLSTTEAISVNKPVFRVGKERSYVDYFVTNNIAVSRSHADIITRGNRYFIKDLNSKNHTYINDEKIPINLEIEIHDGDYIKLGNEEFVFNI